MVGPSWRGPSRPGHAGPDRARLVAVRQSRFGAVRWVPSSFGRRGVVGTGMEWWGMAVRAELVVAEFVRVRPPTQGLSRRVAVRLVGVSRGEAARVWLGLSGPGSSGPC